MSKPEHILVIRFSAMGDVAMTVPVLKAFAKQYPNVRLTVTTKTAFKPLFRDVPNTTIVGADLKSKHKGVLGLYKLSQSLKNTGFECVADLHNVLRSKLLKLFFFGTKVVQIDKGRAEKKALVSGAMFQQLKTTHERYAEVFKQLGFPIELRNPIFPKPSQLSARTTKLIGNTSAQYIGVAPYAAFKGKAYPLTQMERVIKELSIDYKIVLFGAQGSEANELETLAARHSNVINLAGKLSLDEELDVISNLELMISMDSGNAHLAAMQGVKVLTIWGITHPYAGFYPFHQEETNAVLANRQKFPKIPTSVYGNVLPKGYEEVFSSISPQAILDKVATILK